MPTLFKNGLVITMDKENKIIPHGNILVEGDSITSITTSINPVEDSSIQIIDASDMMILPGMINSGLAPLSIFYRGIPFEPTTNSDFWINIKGSQPISFLQELTYWSTLLAGIEMIRSGVTTVVHLWPTEQTPPIDLKNSALKAYQDLGIRVFFTDELKVTSQPFTVFEPLSDLEVGNPLLPTHKYLSNGEELVIATGNYGSNHNMFMLLKLAFSLQRIMQPDYRLWPTNDQIFKMAFSNGASYCGLAESIGSLEVGKKADLVLFNLKTTSFSPLNNPLDQLLCLEDGSSIEQIYINGNCVFKSGNFLDIKWENVREKINSLSTQININ